MRATYLLTAGLIAAFAGTAHAQGTGTPLYNNAPIVYGAANGAQPDVPLYNTDGPIATSIPGRNAPSYNYAQSQTAGQSFGALSPSQALMARAQRDANAQAATSDYQQRLQMARAMRDQQMAASFTNGEAFLNGAVPNFTPADENRVPTKKRVLYKELNDPLKEPPRLFNID